MNHLRRRTLKIPSLQTKMSAVNKDESNLVQGEWNTVIAALITASALSLVFIVSQFAFPVSMVSPYSPIRVACVGDSITEGSYYPHDLQTLLGASYTVGNFGVGGSTVLTSSAKPFIFNPTFQESIVFDANIVVIMLGTNDAWPEYYGQIDNFVRDYVRLINEFQVENPKIWLVKPPPIFNDGLGPNSANLIDGIIPRIEQVANELGLPVIDVYTPLLDHPNYFSDGIHPTSDGAEVIAAIVYEAISNR